MSGGLGSLGGRLGSLLQQGQPSGRPDRPLLRMLLLQTLLLLLLLQAHLILVLLMLVLQMLAYLDSKTAIWPEMNHSVSLRRSLQKHMVVMAAQTLL